jgi:hypothetical protein
MRYEHIAPSCVRPKEATIPCSTCMNEMRLAILEPHPRSRLEILTYRCAVCNRDETFIVSTK